MQCRKWAGPWRASGGGWECIVGDSGVAVVVGREEVYPTCNRQGCTTVVNCWHILPGPAATPSKVRGWVQQMNSVGSSVLPTARHRADIRPGCRPGRRPLDDCGDVGKLGLQVCPGRASPTAALVRHDQLEHLRTRINAQLCSMLHGTADDKEIERWTSIYLKARRREERSNRPVPVHCPG